MRILALVLLALAFCGCTARPSVTVPAQCRRPPLPAELRETPPPPPPLAPGYADGGNATVATPADLLTHAADYGRWCRGLEAQRDALLKLYENMK